MPVRRVDHQVSAAIPAHPTSQVTDHYQSFIPKEMPHGANLKLQNSISHAKGDRHDTKHRFAHRTGILTTLNDPHTTGHEADAELLASATALKGVESCCSPATQNKLKSCGTLTTSRAAYNDLLEGETSDSRAYLRGVSAKPEQYHELPYGCECDYVIGSKQSIYRADFCTSKAMLKNAKEGRAPNSPRLVSVNAHTTTASSVTSVPRQSTTSATTSPRDRAVDPQRALGYNVYYGGLELVGSERAERAADSQARREMEYLKSSASKIANEALSMRSVSEAILTPRTQKLQAIQSSSSSAVPQPPSPRNRHFTIPTPPTSGQRPNVPPSLDVHDVAASVSGSSTAGTAGRSPRLQPILFNRSVLNEEVPSAPSSGRRSGTQNKDAYVTSGAAVGAYFGGTGPTSDMYVTGPRTYFKKGLSTTQTIPSDVSPKSSPK